MALQVGHVEYLNALHRVDYVFGVGRQLGDALLKVEYLFGKLGGLEAGGSQQLDGIFQKHLVGVDRLHEKSEACIVSFHIVSFLAEKKAVLMIQDARVI